jgi:hypothetical protein
MSLDSPPISGEPSELRDRLDQIEELPPRALRQRIYEVERKAVLAIKLFEDKLSSFSIREILSKISRAETASKLPLELAITSSAALSGDFEFHFGGDLDSRDVSADDLNAATAGTYKEVFSVVAKTAGNLNHIWASFSPTLVADKSVVDSDVGLPTLNSPTFDGGGCIIEVTFDTDEGATKTYAPNDSVTVDIQVASDDKLFGMWTVTKKTFTFNIV